MEEFEWDEANEEHVAYHNVTPEEAEEALTDPLLVTATARRAVREPRWAVVGATEAGRILFVVFTRRRGAIRVVTARDATRAEKRRYRR